MLAFISRAPLSGWQVRLYLTKGYFEKLHLVHKGTAVSKQNCQEQNALDRCFPYFNHNESLTTVLISVIAVSLTLHSRLAHMGRRQLVCVIMPHQPKLAQVVLVYEKLFIPYHF